MTASVFKDKKDKQKFDNLLKKIVENNYVSKNSIKYINSLCTDHNVFNSILKITEKISHFEENISIEFLSDFLSQIMYDYNEYEMTIQYGLSISKSLPYTSLIVNDRFYDTFLDINKTSDINNNEAYLTSHILTWVKDQYTSYVDSYNESLKDVNRVHRQYTNLKVHNLFEFIKYIQPVVKIHISKKNIDKFYADAYYDYDGDYYIYPQLENPIQDEHYSVKAEDKLFKNKILKKINSVYPIDIMNKMYPSNYSYKVETNTTQSISKFDEETQRYISKYITGIALRTNITINI